MASNGNRSVGLWSRLVSFLDHTFDKSVDKTVDYLAILSWEEDVDKYQNR